MVQYPPLALNFTQTYLCDTPFATYHAAIVRYPIKTSMKEFCDTIASIESALTTSMSKKRGFTKFSVFPNPRVRTNFVGLFLLKEQQEGASKFGSILGRDPGLVNSCCAAVGRAPNWTGRALNSSYSSIARYEN